MADIISFETGLKTFSLNDKCEVTFNPTDVSFLEKLYNAAEQLDARQERFRDESKNPENAAKLFELARVCDAEIREIIDGLFDAPVCAAVFPEVSMFAVGDGFPVWANLLYAVVDKMDGSLTAEKATAQKRIRKYSAKYK